MSTDHSNQSIYSSYSAKEMKDSLYQIAPSYGSHKVRYNPHSDWDFHLDVARGAVDLSLLLPHYRARNQPVDHRLALFVGHEMDPVKLKVCRNFPRSKFYLEVQAITADVTIWLPSDFKGRIHHSGKASFSSGFVNRIMHNSKINGDLCEEDHSEDEVTVVTGGRIAFRMWDVQTGAPENTQKETFKRMFGCARKNPETCVNWDFLLEDN